MCFFCLSSVIYTCALVTPYDHVGFVDFIAFIKTLINALRFASGGNTSVENNPKHDGDDGTSILGPGGELFLDPLKGNVQRI